MTIVAVPYHIDELLNPFEVGVITDREVVVDLPTGTAWDRMAAIYERVAQLVAHSLAEGGQRPIVISGDCTTSLGVLTGMRRAGLEPGVVWLDGHADFQTEATTSSGYLGGMPLSLAVGVGTLTLPTTLGLAPLDPTHVVLVDARDTDPPEHVLLDESAIKRATVLDLDSTLVPDGDVYVHIDLDVIDPVGLPDLRFPAPGGPSLDEVLAAVSRVAATGRVAAVGIAATWRPDSVSQEHHTAVRRLVETLRGSVRAER